jgi:hypothetical protein
LTRRCSAGAAAPLTSSAFDIYRLLLRFAVFAGQAGSQSRADLGLAFVQLRPVLDGLGLSAIPHRDKKPNAVCIEAVPFGKEANLLVAGAGDERVTRPKILPPSCGHLSAPHDFVKQTRKPKAGSGSARAQTSHPRSLCFSGRYVGGTLRDE